MIAIKMKAQFFVTVSTAVMVSCSSNPPLSERRAGDFICPIIIEDGVERNFIPEGQRGKGDYAVSRESIPSVFSNPKSVVIGNLSQKFGAVANAQDSIAQSIINRGPSLIGLKMDDLDASDKQFIELLKKKQLIAIDHISLLQKDLEASLVNKRNHSHEEVLSAMKENKVISSFKYTHDSISKLHLVNSIQLAKSHSKMLREWSLKLETK